MATKAWCLQLDGQLRYITASVTSVLVFIRKSARFAINTVRWSWLSRLWPHSLLPRLTSVPVTLQLLWQEYSQSQPGWLFLQPLLFRSRNPADTNHGSRASALANPGPMRH